MAANLNRNRDVLIIGGGVIGLCIARELDRAGCRRVFVVERGRCGEEASWAAAGMLAPNLETERTDDYYRFCCESNRMYPAFAAELESETGIDIQLDRSGTLFLAFTDDDLGAIRPRFEKQRAAGIEVDHLTREQIGEIEPAISSSVREGLLYPSDGQVENRRLLSALRQYAELREIRIIESAEVRELLVEHGRVAGVRTANHELRADHTVLATGAWTSLITIPGGQSHVPIKPIRGQMICYEPGDLEFKRVICSPRGYLVPRSDGRILAGATVEDVGFDNQVTETAVEALRSAAAEMAQFLGGRRINERWAGLRPFAPDALPVIGMLSGLDGLTIATGHYRNGILLAPLTAKCVVEWLIYEKVSPYFARFSPDRFLGRMDIASV
jgi:glycine oxidase